MTPLPVTVEQITRAWLNEALAERYPGVVLTAAAVRTVIPGTSTKIRVAVEYDRASLRFNLPTSLIIKGGFEEHSPILQPMYFNEMRFYRDVQPLVDIHSPECFYAGTDASSHQSIVIMEDLVPRSVVFCDPLQTHSYAQVARRLAAMARYHAQTWNSAEFIAGGKLDWVGGRHEGWSIAYQERYLQAAVWDHYMSLPRGTAVPKQFRDSEWMRTALRNLGASHQPGPHCLVHGDTHLGNLYIETDGTPGFFDAQVARGPWQLEVSYHLICALDIADRRRWERPLLGHYLEALSAHGVVAPDFDLAWEAHRRELAYGLFIFLINETRFQTESINTAYAARFGSAALDHDTYRLLQS